jgi:hypothetical protein
LVELNLAPDENHTQRQKNDCQGVATRAQGIGESARHLVAHGTQGVKVGQGDEETDDEERDDREVALVTLPEIRFGLTLGPTPSGRLFYRLLFVSRLYHNHLTY